MLRQHYVTQLRLSEDLTQLHIDTYDSLLPRTRTRTVNFSDVNLSEGSATDLAGKNLEKRLLDMDEQKIMFKVTGDRTNYLLDHHTHTVDPSVFKLLVLVLSGHATTRSVKEAMRKARKSKAKAKARA